MKQIARLPPALVLVMLSFALAATLPLLAKTPLGTIFRHPLSDHIRHPHLVRLAMTHGARIYSTPFGELAKNIDYPYPCDEWLDVPYMYPPGALVYFLPATLLGMTGALTLQHFGIVIILYLLLFAHVGLYQCFRLLRVSAPGLRVLVGFLCWLVLVHVSLNGQYDAAWLGCAAVGFLRVRQDKPASALRWVSLAALLHFRAVMLVPLGLYALIATLKGKAARAWPWPTFAIVAATGVVCAAAFITMAPGARADYPPLVSVPGEAMLWIVIALCVVTSLTLWRLGENYAAGGVLLACVCGIVDIAMWWHATLMLPVVLGISVLGHSPRPALSRVVTIVWYVVMQLLVWGGSNPLWLFKDAVRYLKL